MKYGIILMMGLCLGGCANTKLQAIKDKSGDEMLALKGKPITKVREGGREMWSYRQDTCTEIVFFNAQGRVEDLHELGECPIPE